MRIIINQTAFDIPEGTSILQALRLVKAPRPEPLSLGTNRALIPNTLCPLLGIAEVNGLLMPLPLLENRPIFENLVIVTDTPQIRQTLESRANLLSEKHECFFINEWQKMIAAEGENAGFITLDDWEHFTFEPRGAPPAIVHDPNKCIRCRACVDACRDIQGVEALRFDEKSGVQFDETRCMRCGQCIHRCPMGAIAKFQAIHEMFHCGNCPFAKPLGAMHEQDDTQPVLDLLRNPTLYCVTQFAPAVRSSLGEEFGFPEGELVTNKIYSALRRLGFKKIWDTNFAADLTIVEESSEFIFRFTHNGRLPMFTSCSPGWVRFVETFFPDLLEHLSTAKSPQQMFGAIAKTLGAKTLQIPPESMRVISIMPCTAKKAEASRPEMNAAEEYWKKANSLPANIHFPDVDLVLTTREFTRMLKMAKIDLRTLPDEAADPLLGTYSGAAPIFGRTGGVMEAALRTAISALSGKPPASLEFEELGSLDGIKRAQLPLGDKILKVAVAHGLANARKICESVRAGGEFAEYHFIEIMTCPGGCIGGGGQPIPTNGTTRAARTRGLNQDDREKCAIRLSHENPEIKEAYRCFIEKPFSPLAHQLLHTHYTPRENPNPTR